MYYNVVHKLPSPVPFNPKLNPTNFCLLFKYQMTARSAFVSDYSKVYIPKIETEDARIYSSVLEFSTIPFLLSSA